MSTFNFGIYLGVDDSPEELDPVAEYLEGKEHTQPY
jgi:hypothetical protein